MSRPSEIAAHGAEGRAARDAERVGRGQRIPEERLEHDARRRQRAADQGGHEDARQPRDEENLRVHVVGKRKRRRRRRVAIEIEVEPTSGAATQGSQQQPAGRKERRRQPRSDGAHGPVVRPVRSASRSGGRPGDGAARRRDAVERPDGVRRQHRLGGALREHPPIPQQHERAAQRRRRSSDRAWTDHRHAPLAVQAQQQVVHVELVPDIQRRRGLVQQQQLGLLREGARDHDALLLAAAERREEPRLERRRAGGFERGAARSRDRRDPRARTCRGAGSGPSARCRAP